MSFKNYLCYEGNALHTFFFNVRFLILWQASFIGSGYLVAPGGIEVGADKGETKRKRRSVDSSAAGVSESQGLIQSLKDEIESIKRPSGTQTNPARSCKDLHMCRGDLKDGRRFWWLYIVVFDKWTMCSPALLRLFRASFLSGQALILGQLWFGFDNPWRNFVSSSLFSFFFLLGIGKGSF